MAQSGKGRIFCSAACHLVHALGIGGAAFEFLKSSKAKKLLHYEKGKEKGLSE
jgi:hypothetical protein